MPYAISGSFASALHGVTRATMDAGLHLLSDNPERRAYVASAEDIVPSKLERYRLGGEMSDRQWRSI